MPRVAEAEPTPRDVLLVADGLSPQEDDIENHFLDLGWETARIKDHRVSGATSFDDYDLVVLFESSPFVTPCGLDALKASNVPVLLFETLSFQYAYRLGLTTTPLPGLASDDTVFAVREGYDAFTSRVGAEALVYQPQALIFGVTANRLKPGVTPIFASDGCVSRVAVFADYARKIAATGLTDTAKYTVDAWKMFDILVSQMLPAPEQRYATLDDVAQAYFDSGLYDFIQEVEAEVQKQSGTWTYESAEEEAWLLVTEWQLAEMWDGVVMQLGDIFGISVTLPGFSLSLGHAQRPHGDERGFLPDDPPYDAEHEYWFLGQYWNSLGIPDAPPKWGSYHNGTDLGLGMNVKLNGRSYYYMGDTGDLGTSSSPIYKWSFNNCGLPFIAKARCNDMIVVSSDDDPSDGIDVSPIIDANDNWKPTLIPGVHNAFSPELHVVGSSTVKYWTERNEEPPYTVPSGAASTWIWKKRVNDNGLIYYVPLPMVMLWYGTATNTGYFPKALLSSSDPQRRPTSWVGCSFDGETFYPCYADADGNAVPFSIDEAPPPMEDGSLPAGRPSLKSGKPARFIQVASVNLYSSDFESMCSDVSKISPMCTFSDSGGGLLLYGSGRPYRKSGLFLAFIAYGELGELDPDTGRPVAHYWTGEGWSTSEEDAVSLTGTPPCDNWLQPNYDEVDSNNNFIAGCWPEGTQVSPKRWDYHTVFSEISARVIRSEDPDVSSQIVLLNNNPWNKWVLAWRAPLRRPWAGDFPDITPTDTLTYGYAPYIIDEFSDSEYTGDDITLWHTVSVWQGEGSNTPYGVYTGSEVISWQ